MPFRGAQNGTYSWLLPVSGSSYLELSQRANTSSSSPLDGGGVDVSVGLASIVVVRPELSVVTTGVTVDTVPSLSRIDSHGVGAAVLELEVEVEVELLDSSRARLRLGTAATRAASRSRNGTRGASGTEGIIAGGSGVG